MKETQKIHFPVAPAAVGFPPLLELPRGRWDVPPFPPASFEEWRGLFYRTGCSRCPMGFSALK